MAALFRVHPLFERPAFDFHSAAVWPYFPLLLLITLFLLQFFFAPFLLRLLARFLPARKKLTNRATFAFFFFLWSSTASSPGFPSFRVFLRLTFFFFLLLHTPLQDTSPCRTPPLAPRECPFSSYAFSRTLLPSPRRLYSFPTIRPSVFFPTQSVEILLFYYCLSPARRGSAPPPPP